jgi:type IV pilus assembly protein PilC
MLDAGLTLSRGIIIIAKQMKNSYFKETLEKIEASIRTGKTFHEALADYPKIFSNLFISMVAAGEESGKLAESLETVGGQMEKNYVLLKKVKGALLYPSIIITAMLGIGIFMLVYVVPTLTSTFKELNVELPATTQLIISVSDAFRNHFVLVIAFIAGVIIGLIALARTKTGSRLLDKLFLKLPVIGNLIKEMNAARTARTLSSLLTSGVSVVESLKITGNVLQNPFYKEVLAEAEKKIQVGSPISDVFIKSNHVYPIYVGEMIAVGEETGEMGAMLAKVAQFFEAEVEQKTKDMSTIIEPILMVVVGIGVGFFAISMLSPMYSIANNI